MESEKEIGIPSTISLRIKEALPNILSILSIPVSKGNEVELQQNETTAFLFIAEFLRLSETERIQLKDWMIGYKIRTGNSSEQGLNILKNANGTLNLKEAGVKTREEGRKGLYALKQFYQS